MRIVILSINSVKSSFYLNFSSSALIPRGLGLPEQLYCKGWVFLCLAGVTNATESQDQPALV